MQAAVTWDNISVAGAFLVGTIFGTVVTMRILRIAIGLLKKRRDEEA
jgi:hypothetical protein